MTMADTSKCANCAKTKSDLGIDLKRCAKCQTTHYCSRECQKADWKCHKRACASYAASASAPATPSMSTTAAQPPKGLSVTIDKPFHRLDSQTWLHDRPKQDVYVLLIDTYRFRVEDDYNLEGGAEDDSIYGGAHDGRHGFRRFLRLAERRSGLLPSWWSQEKAAECEAVGMNDGWSSLANAIEKSDVIEHYGTSNMPMQLRMFGEQVYGRGPGGQSGAAMRQVQMMAEKRETYRSA
jgi:splicing suppressor protein 51